MSQSIERWGIFELALEGPAEGNPFVDGTFEADFRLQNRVVPVTGFYDGDGLYRVRFMPDALGEWQYTTRSSAPALQGKSGAFTCTPPSNGNHGPVVVRNMVHFAYADGAPYFPIGTTCYAWAHQGDAREQQTLATLSSAPFNKMRMCVFPKHYDFNHNEPEFFPYERSADGSGWDFSRFNPRFFQHFERLVGALCEMGIEADLILLHPYDRWGFANMGVENDDRFLRYLVTRLAAYRNVWWSMANEYDLMKDRTLADWDRYFKIVQESDPYQHLRSVHNCRGFYDHAKPWVTHASVQSSALDKVRQWRAEYQKPIVVDECCYEGDIWHFWGNITAREMMHRFWLGTLGGGYVGHGETYLHPEDVLWWGKGGQLHGQSPARIAFLRQILEESTPNGLEPFGENRAPRACDRASGLYLFYTSMYQPSLFVIDLPETDSFSLELIDPWEMSVTPLEGSYQGRCKVNMPGKPNMLVRARQNRQQA